MTLAALSAKAGMHLYSLSKLESGAREPQWGSVIALADALGVKVTAFLPSADTSTKPVRKRPKK